MARPPRTDRETRDLTREVGTSARQPGPRGRALDDPRARADRTGGVPSSRVPASAAEARGLPGGFRTLTSEFGVSGLHRVSGFVFEEYLRDLQGYRGQRVYREMADNDATIHGLLRAIEQIIVGASWRVKPADDSRNSALRAQQFVESCFEDMSHTQRDLLYEVATMFPQGFAWHEIVYKVRRGPTETDAAFRSKYTDGMIGWRKIPLRGQDTLYRWEFDESGGIREFWQISPPDYRLRQIPIEKSLLFRPKAIRNNPEGASILRGAYRTWYFRKRLEELESIGTERDLVGLPVITPPEGYDLRDPQNLLEVQEVQNILVNIRRDEQEGVLKPFGWTFELLKGSGPRQIDVRAAIDSYNRLSALTVLGQFLLLGMTNVGSFALSEIQQDIFLMAVSGWLFAIADVFNRYAIPRLCQLNGIAEEDWPTFEASEVREPKLQNLAQFIAAMVPNGVITPDTPLENYLRAAAHLPAKDEEGEQETILDAARRGVGMPWWLRDIVGDQDVTRPGGDPSPPGGGFGGVPEKAKRNGKGHR